MTFNGERLRVARWRRGLSKVQLAEQAGLTTRRLGAFENEGVQPGPATLEVLSTTLDFPPEFFCIEPTADIMPGAVSIRASSRLSARRRDAALAVATLAVDVNQWVSARFRLPAPTIPDLTGAAPATAAASLRASWALGDDPAPNLVHLLEANGARVFSVTDDCVAVDAFSMWDDGIPYVFLTRHKSPERGRWDAAHELGHLALHRETGPDGRAAEVEADDFASEFLLPAGGVIASARQFPSLQDVQADKVVWRVSALAYLRRLHQLGRLTAWQYRSMVIEASQAGYRRTEGDIERETSQLIPKVLELLRQDGVSIRDVAADLHLRPADLRGLIFSTVGIVQGEGRGPAHGRQPVLKAL
jgi:Zn-dependent peptidase ImmA (M78 family)/transcriptional regulator with XRE-family HTH domain